MCWVPAASARARCPLAYLGTPWKERRDRSVLRGWPPRVKPSMPHGRGSHPLLPPPVWRVCDTLLNLGFHATTILLGTYCVQGRLGALGTSKNRMDILVFVEVTSVQGDS